MGVGEEGEGARVGRGGAKAGNDGRRNGREGEGREGWRWPVMGTMG